MKLVSACLAGKKCKWNGKNNTNEKVKKMVERGEAIAACPEILGGLSIPRKPTGIFGGTGENVLNGKATVRAARDGEDLTDFYIKGAEEFLKLAKNENIKIVILRNKSPSCGCGKTWQLDKEFKNHLVDGDGVTAALLKKHGIEVKNEKEI